MNRSIANKNTTNRILTAVGTQHHLSGTLMAENEFDIRWIASACAQINRFSGHCIRPLSVAEHQLTCADIAEHLNLPPVVQLACLMHDAHEAIVGDCTSPVKVELGEPWEYLEQVHANALRRWFGLNSTFAGYRRQIREIDLMALATERRDLMVWKREEGYQWPAIDTPGTEVPAADWIDLRATYRCQRTWGDWRDLFLERFHQLRAERATAVSDLISQSHQAQA